MILKEHIYQTLRDDVALRTLLSKSATPYGVYFMSPPETPDFPIITYFINAQTGRMPRDIPFMITAWGSNYDAVLDRVYGLLHNQPATVTNYKALFLKWDWASPEMWDDNYKVYFRQDRFLAKGIKL